MAVDGASGLSENRARHLSGPLNRCTVKHDSYMGAARKAKIDPLSHQNRRAERVELRGEGWEARGKEM